MFTANIHVTLKKTVLDPQGVTVKSALKSLGFDTVEDVRVGKYFQVQLNAASQAEAEAKVQEMCKKLFTNPVIEESTFEVVSAGGAAR